MKWTPDQVRQLKSMEAAKLPRSEIAATLGRSKNSVASKVMRLGFDKRRVRRFPRKYYLRKVEKWYKRGYNDKEVAVRIGVSHAVARVMRLELGLPALLTRADVARMGGAARAKQKKRNPTNADLARMIDQQSRKLPPWWSKEPKDDD